MAKKMSIDNLIQIESHDSLTRRMVSYLLQMGVFSLDNQDITDMTIIGWMQQKYWHSDPLLAHWTHMTLYRQRWEEFVCVWVHLSK